MANEQPSLEDRASAISIVLPSRPAEEPFTADQLGLFREAQKLGKLSDDQKQEIIRRMGATAPQDNQPPPIPGIVKPPLVDKRQETLSELTHGFISRPTAEAVGGMGGAVLGAPAGPVGAIAGGGLGAAAGSNTFDAINNFLIDQGLVGGERADLGKVVENAGNAAYWDTMFGAGASLVRPILGGRRIIGKISGLFNREADQLIKGAQERGLSLGASEVGGGLPKGFLRTVSVFPFAAGSAAKTQFGKHKQVIEAVDRILNDLAPNASLASDIGINMARAAKSTTKEFQRVSGILFNRFRDLAKGASNPDIIPTEQLKASAKELYGEATAGQIKLAKTGELSTAALRSPKGSDAVAAFEKYLSDLRDLPEAINIEQYRRLTKDLNDVMSALKAEGVDVRQAGILKRSLEEDLNNIRVHLLPEGEGAALKDALVTANKWYSKGVVQFSEDVATARTPKGFKGKETLETPTAKKFERVDKKFFEPGTKRSGTINEDELFKVAVNLKSVQALNDLEAVIGRPAMRRIARRVMEDAAEKSLATVKIGSIEDKIFDPVAFERALGLTGAGKAGTPALEELLKKGGVKLADIKDLIRAAKSIEVLGDPSTFVRRRAIMGGASAVVTAGAGFGGAVAGGGGLATGTAIVAAGAITLLSRHFSKIFSSPVALKNMLDALDTARNTVARQAALGRVLNFVTRKDDDNTEVGN